MALKPFTFMVTVELEKTEGKFASREELSEQIIQEITSADPSTIDGDNGGTYEVTSWEVTEV